MRTLNLLQEAIGTLFHFTNPVKALSILTHQKFILTPVVKAVERNVHRKAGVSQKQDAFFLSTTRNVMGSFHSHVTNGVMFILDGSKLNTHGKIRSVVYFEDEFEDRLFSKKSEIPTSGLIKEILILMPNDGSYSADALNPVIRKIVINAKQQKIPVKFQTRNGRSPWASPLLSDSDVPDQLKKKSPQNNSRRYIGTRKANFLNLVKFLITTKLPKEKLPPEALKLLNKNFRYRDDAFLIDTELHNALGDIVNVDDLGKLQSPIHELKKVMISHKMTNGDDIFKYVKNKFI